MKIESSVKKETRFKVKTTVKGGKPGGGAGPVGRT